MKKIFLVEDDRFLVRLYKTNLEREGFSVAFIEGGENALEEIKKISPDSILLDSVMPNVDGFDVLKQLRNDPVTKKLNVFVLSGLEGKNDVDKIYEIGAENYLFKSQHSFKQIIEKITKYLS